LFVVDVSSGRDAHGLMTFINPEIIKTEGRIQEDEGCLSLPGVYGPTPRATHVIMRGMNRSGATIEVEGEGLLARAFQHEMDHLQGMLFFNRMGPAARDIVIRKFKRAQRERR
jgi:peptide deformylase